MFSAAVWGKRKTGEKICTMENVFLMCFCERLSACHVCLRGFPARQKKPFLCLAIGGKNWQILRTVNANTLAF